MPGQSRWQLLCWLHVVALDNLKGVAAMISHGDGTASKDHKASRSSLQRVLQSKMVVQAVKC
jgi:hypothetical protein